MHTYCKRWTDDQADRDYPSLSDFRFRGLDDLVRWAELDPVVAWRTWPEVWHLDDDGAFCCGSKGSSLESVQTYAADPDRLLLCRQYVPRPDCPDRWLMLEPRHPRREPYRVCEGDAQAFLAVRSGLAEHGITLLDVVVFDQEFHYWSLNELTSGSRDWPVRLGGG